MNNQLIDLTRFDALVAAFTKLLKEELQTMVCGQEPDMVPPPVCTKDISYHPQGKPVKRITNKDWLTVNEATEYIRCKSKSSLYKYIALNKVRRTKVNSSVLVSKIDLDISLDKNSIRI